MDKVHALYYKQIKSRTRQAATPAYNFQIISVLLQLLQSKLFLEFFIHYWRRRLCLELALGKGPKTLSNVECHT